MHIKTMMDKMIENGKKEDMHYLGDLLVDSVYSLKETDPVRFKNIEYSMYRRAYGDNLTEEKAKCWVASMENKDGTKGEHWTMEQTTSVLKQNGLKYNENDWYAILNSVYSDYYNEKFDTAIYVGLAKDWLDDKDVGECKTLKYYMFVAN